MDTQCPAFIFCKFLEGYWTVVRGNVHHNHECNSLRYDCNTWMRRLTAEELETVKPLLISGTSAFNVIHYAYQSNGNVLLLKMFSICVTKCSHRPTFLVSNVHIYTINCR